MKLWKKILLTATCATLVVILLLSVIGYYALRPTSGPPIDEYDSPRSALLIVDIQEDYTGPQAKKPFRDGDRIVKASNTLLSQAQEKGIPVIFIQNVIVNPILFFLSGGMNAPDSAGTEMDRRLIRVPGSRTFTKNGSDAFSNPELDDYLRKEQVDHLLITGLDGAYCVNSTVQGALNRNYKVTLYPEGIATQSGKSLDELIGKWRKAGAQIKDGTRIGN